MIPISELKNIGVVGAILIRVLHVSVYREYKSLQKKCFCYVHLYKQVCQMKITLQVF